MGLTPKDMDFIEAKNAASRDIALAFGVPPMLLGIPGETSSPSSRPGRPSPAPALRSGACLEHKAAFEAYVRGGEDDGLRRSGAEGALGRHRRRRRLPGAGRDRARDQPAAAATSRRSAPSPASARCRRSSTRSRSRSPARRPAGSARPRRGRDRPRRRSPSCSSRRWSSTPCRRRPRRSSTTSPSTSTSGSPRRCAIAFATAGRHRLRHRRRHQQAEGLPRLHQDRRRPRGPGATSATSSPASPAPSPPSNPSDKLIDLVYTLKSGYRQNAHWVMNRTTQAAIRKLKDADGNYIWQPAAVAGEPAS